MTVDGQTSTTNDAYLTNKLQKTDNDVIEIPSDTPLVQSFKDISDGKITFSAQIEPNILPSSPFLLGAKKTNNIITPDLSYTLGENKQVGPLGDDNLSLNKHDTFAQFKTNSSATMHPNGTAYIWVSNDDTNLYISADWTSDNTYDHGKDFFRAYIKNEVGDVSHYTIHSDNPEGDSGKAFYAYTDKADYQHMYYRLTIPLQDISGNHLQLGFELYGTAAPGPPLCGGEY